MQRHDVASTLSRRCITSYARWVCRFIRYFVVTRTFRIHTRKANQIFVVNWVDHDWAAQMRVWIGCANIVCVCWFVAVDLDETLRRPRTDFSYNSKRLLIDIKQLSRLMRKPTKWHVRPAKTQISLDICLVNYENTPIQIYRKFYLQKHKIFG